MDLGPLIIQWQKAINMEWTLALQYHLCACDLQRWGMKNIPDVIAKLGNQCQQYVGIIFSRIGFAGGAPALSSLVYAPDSVETYKTVADGFQNLIDYETSVVDQYRAVWKAAIAAEWLNDHHLSEHLTKWHQTGGNGFIAHIKWLNQQRNQIIDLGEPNWKQEVMSHEPIEGEA